MFRKKYYERKVSRNLLFGILGSVSISNSYVCFIRCLLHTFLYVYLLYIPFHSSPEQRDVSNLFIMGLLLMIPGAAYEILLFMRNLRRLSLIWTEVDFLLLSIKNSSTALSSPVIPLHINSISFRLCDTGVKIFKTWSNFLQNSNLLFYILNAILTRLI